MPKLHCTCRIIILIKSRVAILYFTVHKGANVDFMYVDFMHNLHSLNVLNLFEDNYLSFCYIFDF